MNKEEKYLENWSNTLELATYFHDRYEATKEIIDLAIDYILENDNLDWRELMDILEGRTYE